VRELRAGDLVLEPQIAAHAAELFAVLSDPQIYQYLDEAAPLSGAALRERLLRLEGRTSPDGSEVWLNWVVREAGAVFGYVQATVYPDHVAEIAYVLGSAHWGRGRAFAACEMMLLELAAAYGVTRVQARVDAGNGKSIALLEKLGLGLVEANGPERLYERRLIV
jgi:[ribosomal protein S5]-alanine N-acetyltransferase